MPKNNSAQDVNATVDGDEDRGATHRDLAQEVRHTGGPVQPHNGELDDVAPAAGDTSPDSETHAFEGSTKHPRSDDQYEGASDRERARNAGQA